MDGFTRVDYEAYLENPFAVCKKVLEYGCEIFEKWKTAAVNHDLGIPLGIYTLYLVEEFKLHPDHLLFAETEKKQDRIRVENVVV